MFKIKCISELKDEDRGLFKKCEICHKDIAVKSKITLAGKKIWLCKMCLKQLNFKVEVNNINVTI